MGLSYPPPHSSRKSRNGNLLRKDKAQTSKPKPHTGMDVANTEGLFVFLQLNKLSSATLGAIVIDRF
jgi:hypothetical protein